MTGARCGSCQAAVVWTVTEAGKALPVNELPIEGGNVEVTADGALLTSRVLGPMEASLVEGPLYLSHFVTCPQAGEWRKRKRR